MLTLSRFYREEAKEEVRMTSLATEIARKWFWLRAQTGFQRAPVRTTFRFFFWGARCALRREAIVKIRKWNLRMRLPATWRSEEHTSELQSHSDLVCRLLLEKKKIKKKKK